MKEFNCDLQLHGKFAAGVSKYMEIPLIAQQSKLKGLQIVSTADILNKAWFEHARENIVETENGVFEDKKGQVNFIVGTEVEDNNRVHHLIYLENFDKALELREKLKQFGNLDGMMNGRPRIKLNGEQIAEIVIDEVNGIIGPSHAFTPYFGAFGHFDSLKQCYGKISEKILFLELGLSSDSYFADLIKENHSLQFLTGSDAHSAWPHRLGREFTRIKMKKPCFSELKKAVKEKEESLITLNAGLDPREGKYHCSACNSCYQKYSFEQAERQKWKCVKCKSTIKRGVRDRIAMLSENTEEKHPGFRPKYLHLLPLAEIIQLTLKHKNPLSKETQEIWKKFVDLAGSEINALVDAPMEELIQLHKEIGKSIEAFRNGFVIYIPGGGGNYGTPIICKNKTEFEQTKTTLKNELECKNAVDQKTLMEF